MKKKEKKIKVVWDDEAKKSLRSVYDHIKDRESVRVARRVRTEILKLAPVVRTSLTLLSCHPSAWLKVEGECCAQVVQASDVPFVLPIAISYREQ